MTRVGAATTLLDPGTTGTRWLCPVAVVTSKTGDTGRRRRDTRDTRWFAAGEKGAALQPGAEAASETPRRRLGRDRRHRVHVHAVELGRRRDGRDLPGYSYGSSASGTATWPSTTRRGGDELASSLGRRRARGPRGPRAHPDLVDLHDLAYVMYGSPSRRRSSWTETSGSAVTRALPRPWQRDLQPVLVLVRAKCSAAGATITANVGAANNTATVSSSEFRWFAILVTPAASGVVDCKDPDAGVERHADGGRRRRLDRRRRPEPPACSIRASSAPPASAPPTTPSRPSTSAASSTARGGSPSTARSRRGALADVTADGRLEELRRLGATTPTASRQRRPPLRAAVRPQQRLHA